MYSVINYKSKKAIREAIATHGNAGGIYQPGPFGGNEPSDGIVLLEGPHYPEPHRWYARVEVRVGRIVKVLA